jgi:hypothetical protein
LQRGKDFRYANAAVGSRKVFPTLATQGSTAKDKAAYENRATETRARAAIG